MSPFLSRALAHTLVADRHREVAERRRWRVVKLRRAAAAQRVTVPSRVAQEQPR